jgi:FK506-binding protein 3
MVVMLTYVGVVSLDGMCRYTGMLENGHIFDTNVGKKKSALKFKVGMGKVIRGWDEAVLEMSKGEKAKITIEPDWAYGAKGTPQVTLGSHCCACR